MDDCDREIYAMGYCEPHYRRLRRTGNPAGAGKRPRPRRCSVQGCDRPVDARDLCHGHYQRLARTGSVEEGRRLSRRRNPRRCTIDGCDRPTHGKGLCRTHYNRMKRYGDPRADVPIKRVLGTGSLSHGYLKVPVPKELRHLTNGETPVVEHRLVMAQHLGRALFPDEVVHHINGEKTDNRLENLELWTTSHPKGQRVEDKVAWARQILARYRPDLLAPSEESEP